MLLGRWALGAAMVSALTVSIPTSAQGSLQDQLAVCARIAKKNARVECYDSIARANSQAAVTVNSGASSIDAPRAAPQSPMAAEPVRSAGFGAEQIARPLEKRSKDEGDSEMDVVVASARDNGLSMWTMSLADGAVWRMTERASDFRPPMPQERVTISKGALGSYLMQVGKQAAVRVQRVR